jgi:hypothetical protein
LRNRVPTVWNLGMPGQVIPQGGRKEVELMRRNSETGSASVGKAGLLLAVTAGLALSAAPAFAEAYQLDYKVTHSKHGNIGTYTNTVVVEGQTTTVTTKLNIQVRVIGITAYRQTAERVEKWQGGRLVYLHGLTTTNGKPSEVDGVAKGDHFEVTTAKGSEQAPAGVRVANPWSTLVLNGDTIVTPDDGTISKVQVSAPQDTMVTKANGSVAAKQYDIDLLGLKKRYQVWLDNSGTPAKFDMIDDQGTVIFTLNSKTPVNPLVANR